MKIITDFDVIGLINDNRFDKLNGKPATFGVDLKYGRKDVDICFYSRTNNSYNAENSELLTKNSNVK